MMVLLNHQVILCSILQQNEHEMENCWHGTLISIPIYIFINFSPWYNVYEKWSNFLFYETGLHFGNKQHIALYMAQRVLCVVILQYLEYWCWLLHSLLGICADIHKHHNTISTIYPWYLLKECVFVWFIDSISDRNSVCVPNYPSDGWQGKGFGDLSIEKPHASH